MLDHRLFTCACCKKLLSICRTCDRGQEYCAGWCRDESRKVIVADAKRRHQQSDEGRADHREHQAAYRARLRAGVTDLGSEDLAHSPTVSVPAAARVSEVEPPQVAGGSHDDDDERHNRP